MKANFVVKGAFVMLSIGCSLSSSAQVDSPTMFLGLGNTYGTSASYYGAYNNISGSHSFGGGRNTDVTGSYSVGLGYNTNVSGVHSFGFGYGTDVTSHYAVGMGYNVEASGTRSLSLGSQTQATASYSTAIGKDVQSTALGAITLGYGYSGSSPLVNNVTKSLMFGMNSDLPTMTLAPATGIGTVGNVGIGGAPSSIKRLTVSKLNGLDYEYGLSVVTDNELTRALTVNNAAGDDLFVVWGNGVTNINKLYAEEIEVTYTAIGMYWPDYVFKNDYQLRPLSEVSEFIKTNSHLPDVPSEKEISEDGINLGQMDAVLLRKVEELTLYIIEQQKQIDELKTLMEDTQN